MKRLFAIVTAILAISTLQASEIPDHHRADEPIVLEGASIWETQRFAFNGQAIKIATYLPRIVLDNSQLYVWFANDEAEWPYDQSQSKYSLRMIPRYQHGIDLWGNPEQMLAFCGVVPFVEGGFCLLEGDCEWSSKGTNYNGEYRNIRMLATAQNIIILQHTENLLAIEHQDDDKFFNSFAVLDEGMSQDGYFCEQEYLVIGDYHPATEWQSYTYGCSDEVIRMEMPILGFEDIQQNGITLQSFDFDKRRRPPVEFYLWSGALESNTAWRWDNPVHGDWWYNYLMEDTHQRALVRKSTTITPGRQVVDVLYKGGLGDYAHKRIIMTASNVYLLVHEFFDDDDHSDDQRFFDSFEVIK